MSSVHMGSAEKGDVNHLSCFFVGLRGVPLALLKAATMDGVQSCIRVLIASERSFILNGGWYHALSRSGGPGERILSGCCRRTLQSRRCEMLLMSRWMRSCRQVLLPPSVSTSVKLRALYAAELGPSALRMSLHMALRSATSAHELQFMR